VHDFVVAIVSQNSVSSSWCQKELSLAVTKGINNNEVVVLPVRLGDVPMPPSLDDVRHLPAEATTSPTQVAKELVQSINTHLRRRQKAREREPSAVTPSTTDAVRQSTSRSQQGDMDATLAALDGIHEATMAVVQMWQRARDAGGSTDEIKQQQRRLEYQLDVRQRSCARHYR
jgi:hypothetical protein